MHAPACLTVLIFITTAEHGSLKICLALLGI